MTTVTRCWWIRHAPVVDNGGRIYGRSDIDADTSDRSSFTALARRLPNPAVWVTSDLRRTQQTAAAIAAAGPTIEPPRIERDIAEQDFGEWQGRKRDEIFAREAEWHQFWLAPAQARPPGGESFVDLIGRVVPAIDRLVAEHAGRDLVLVAHGGSIRAALAGALGLDPETALAFAVDNLSLTRIDHIATTDEPRSAWRVVAVNHPARPGI